MLYYLPAVARPTPEKIAEAGLAYAFEAKPLAVEVMRGPFDGPGGIVLCDPRAPQAERLGYYPDQQTWRKIPGAKSFTEHGAVCVGMWNDVAARPGPEHLARRFMLRGHAVQMSDGRIWECPAAVHYDEGDPVRRTELLPHEIDTDEAGEWVTGPIRREYRRQWEIAQRWQSFYAQLHNPETEEDRDVETDLLLTDVFDDAAACLATNYRLAKIEIAMLGLFSESSARDVLNAVIDWPGLVAILQKKTGDS